MELPPGVDVCHASVRKLRGHNIRQEVKHRRFEQSIRIVVGAVQAFGEVECGWIEHFTDRYRLVRNRRQGMLVAFCQLRMQAVDLALAGIAQGISIDKSVDMQVQVRMIVHVGIFAQQVFVGESIFSPPVLRNKVIKVDAR